MRQIPYRGYVITQFAPDAFAVRTFIGLSDYRSLDEAKAAIDARLVDIEKSVRRDFPSFFLWANKKDGRTVLAQVQPGPDFEIEAGPYEQPEFPKE
ncbi:MAG: hypothetical protein ACTHLZ_17425 [Tepidisphaeraceae bacterium]